jgi:hypothetical protein
MSTQQQPVGMSDELNAGGCVEDQIVERQKRGPKEARQSKEKRSAKSGQLTNEMQGCLSKCKRSNN